MKRGGAAIAAVAVLGIGLGIFALRHEPAPSLPVAGLAPPSRTERAKETAPAAGPLIGTKSAPPASPEQRAAARQSIEEAVTTYEQAAVKTIAAFLQDPDPDIRLAARDGLIQLGEQDAIPILRQAATRMSDAAEATACREAADYLELPSWSDTPEGQEALARIRARHGK
ncbi:HEAT repeat domain-containing protein [Luteolibacter ambystomatis]|uniref:HEAT repeat domain-containing protein n=1 Tax=Luteolibacter ambystomatis TaxID=2824561 RepID=A0A975PG66_9BACT|nr:HEAT repeat domain-containing protein [Luteolibacter ambystomatis]QUE52047.1 HEAT repeat domain-containing protein [Luteolibacter ambystomatis]